jgi:uncharacterized protein (TIGR03435 family)
MKHRTVCLFAVLAVIAGSASAQQGDTPAPAQPPLSFEVATVKATTTRPEQGEFGGIRALPGGQTYKARYVPLKLMMKLMFKITDSQIVGGPDWMNTEMFDVLAKSEKPTTLDNLHIMFQNLLIERFKIQFHRETRTLPAFVLTLDKGGSKMKVNEDPDPFEIPIKGTPTGPPPAPPTFTGTRCNMEYFGWWLGQLLNGIQQSERPVVDQTGLKGFYDFKLSFAPDLAGRTGPNGEPPPSFDGPSIFQALKEQLGLKLESTKGPVVVFVIDHVEKPTEN